MAPITPMHARRVMTWSKNVSCGIVVPPSFQPICDQEKGGSKFLSGCYDIHAGGVAKPAQELFAVLPRQTERPYIGYPQARDHIANVGEVRLFELAFHHRRFRPGDKIRTREVMAQVRCELIRHHLTSDFTHYI